MILDSNEHPRRRPVNLTIRADILEQAKSLDLNASQAAENGILDAIRAVQGERWLKENGRALAAHNVRVEKKGVLLPPRWAGE